MIKNNAATEYDLTDKSITPMVWSIQHSMFVSLLLIRGCFVRRQDEREVAIKHSIHCLYLTLKV